MQESIIYSVNDFKVFPLTTPATPVYGPPIDVPGISEVAVDAQVIENALRGDNVILHQTSVLEAVTLAFTYGRLSPTVLSAIDGGSASQNAGGDTDRYVRSSDDAIPEWGFAALVSQVDSPGGAAKFYGYRGRQTGAGIFGASDSAYGQPSFDARFIPLAVGPIFAVDLEDTATALPTDSASFIATYADLV